MAARKNWKWRPHSSRSGEKEEKEKRSSLKANNVIISTTHLVHTAKALSFSPWYLYRSANAWKRPYLVSHSTQSWRSHPVSTATKVSSSGELVSAYNLSSATSISCEWKKTRAPRPSLILGRRKTEVLQFGCWHTSLKKKETKYWQRISLFEISKFCNKQLTAKGKNNWGVGVGGGQNWNSYHFLPHCFMARCILWHWCYHIKP